MEREKVWVLTICEDGEYGDVFVHLFRNKESAIEYVLDGIREDMDNGGYASAEAFNMELKRAKEELDENNCWHDGRNGLDYDLDEKELED